MIALLLRLLAAMIGWRNLYTDDLHDQVIASMDTEAAPGGAYA